MTYRQFLKTYQAKRRAAVPDITHKLPFTKQKAQSFSVKRNRFFIPLTATVVAVICLISTVLLLPLQSSFPPPADVSGASLPPDLKVSAVLYKTLKAGSDVLPSDATIDQYVGARMVAITADTPFTGHETCTGVFYQLDKKAVFCVDHLILQALSEREITVSGVSIHFYDPTRDVAIFTLSNNTLASYWYHMQTDTLQKLPVSLQHCPSQINTAAQAPYALLHSMGGKHDDLYLIEAQTGKLTNILKDEDGGYLFDPMEDEKLIADNTFVLYTHGTGDGNTVTSPSRTSVLYHIATGKSYTFQGQVEAELADCLLIRNPDGYAVYSLIDHTIKPLENSNLPPQYDYEIRQTDLYSRYSYRLNIQNRRTEETTLLCDNYIVAHLISPDHRYVYYYVRGENFIRVHDIATGNQDTLPLFADVSEETESEDHKNNTIFFSLWMNESGNEIVLTYQYTAHPREDPEKIRKEQENSSYHQLLALTAKNKFVSISSLKPLLQRFPERVVAYEGDGYVYLDYTRLITEDEPGFSVQLTVALEDYTHSIFHNLSHINESFDSQFVEKSQHVLSQNAREITLNVLEECGIPILPATKYYLDYFSDETLNKLKVYIEHASSEVLFPQVKCYFVREAYGYDGACRGLEGEVELSALREFLQFSDTLTYDSLLDGAQDDFYREFHNYSVTCSGNALSSDGELYIGSYHGEAFLVRNRCLAYITQAEYQHWSSWLDAQEIKCRTE